MDSREAIITGEQLGWAVGIASIALAVVSLALSAWIYTKSKDAQTETTGILGKIDGSIETLKTLSLDHMGALIRNAAKPKPAEKTLDDIVKILADGNLRGTDESADAGSATKAQLEQFSVDNLIAAMYYCAISNMATRTVLQDVSEENLEKNRDLVGLIDTTHADYGVLRDRLRNTPKVDEKIKNSPVSHLYSQGVSFEENVIDHKKHIEWAESGKIIR